MSGGPSFNKALTDVELQEIHKNVCLGFYDDKEIGRLIDTIMVQRRVLRELFNLWTREPLRRVSTAEPVPNSQLTYLKELVSMEDKKQCLP